jgi:NhaP-type Na+/H+ or K+/H+ antiporter
LTNNNGTLKIGGQVIGEMIGNFFSICFLSVLIGIGFGLLVTLVFKYCRFISNSAITETSLIIVFGFTSYYVSEVAE